MKFEFKPSFDKSVKKFYGNEKDEIKKVAVQAIDILSQTRVTYKGIGLKRLAGDHDDIKRYLKNI